MLKSFCKINTLRSSIKKGKFCHLTSLTGFLIKKGTHCGTHFKMFQGEKAVVYINNQRFPSFIVNKMLGTSKTGSIAR
ncbi:hypothetical protein D3C80_2017220 [compost metagenome]